MDTINFTRDTGPKIKKIYTTELSNYYGTVTLAELDDKTYQLTLDNYNGDSTVKVSNRFAKAFIAEFKHNGVVKWRKQKSEKR